MPLKLNSTGGGSVTVDVPSTASNYTVTIPAATGTMVTTGAGQTVEFAAGTASAPSITATGDTNNGIFFPATDATAITTAGTERMRIDSSGNVGIGTSSPQNRLDVSAPAGSGAIGLRVSDTTNNLNTQLLRTGSTYSYAGVGALETWLYSQGTSNLSLGPDGAGAVKFVTNGSERARIDSSGNLLLGVTSTQTVGGVSYGIHMSHEAWLFNRFPGYDGWRYGQYLADIYWNNNSADRMKLTGGGQLYTTTGTIGGLSDVRFKENIVDAPDYLEKLKSVRIRNFSFKEENSEVPTKIGVIAQELENIIPELVVEDTGSDGSERKVVKYTDFIPMLIKSLQEQQEQIEALTARIAALEAK